MRTRHGVIAVVCAGCITASCFVPGRRGVTAEEYVEGIRVALRNGELRQALVLRDRARRSYPQDGSVLLWCSEVSRLNWEDDRALAELRLLHRTGDRGGLTAPQCAGLIGDLLFRMGRYGESIAYLEQGQVGIEGTRRQAFARLAHLLPYRRAQSGPLATELPLQQLELPELLVSIQGRERPFVVDTGTSMTTLSRGLATALEVSPILPAGTATDGTGRPIPGALGLLSSLRVGEVALGSFPVLVVEDARLMMRDLLGGSPRSPNGVLGLDLLSTFRVTLDPERRSLVLELSRGLSEGESVPCVHHEGRCLAPVAIEGRNLWFVLDTGASHSSLTPAGLRALPGSDTRATETFRRIRTASGSTIAVREVRDLVLRASEVRFRGVHLPVIDRRTNELFPVHGVLGADRLLECRMTLDRGRVRLEPPRE